MAAANHPADWSRRNGAALAVAIVAGIAVRLYWLPNAGYKADIAEFVDAVQRISHVGLGHAYDEHMSFGPVMAYVWGLLSAIEPAFRAGLDAQDAGIRVLVKLPAAIADLGLAALLVYFFRDRPARAVGAAAIVLLNPAIWIDSAWWGQYESVFTLSILAAFILAADRREVAAAVLLGVALMTKPQALPLLLPFAAWFLATGGWWTLVRVISAGGLTILVLWLPFIPALGPAHYLDSLLYYSNEKFGYLSFGAWNAWWLYGETVLGGVAPDTIAVLGPIPAKYVAYAGTGLLALLVGWAIWRVRTVRALAVGLAATSLISFCFLTEMHERYSYAAIVFLLLLLPDRRALALEVAVSVVFVINLAAAASLVGNISQHVDLFGPNAIAGSAAMVGITLLVMALAVGPAVRGMRRDTSGGSGAATSGA
jgi:dolichyl-phosphate-mannose-protein mannosyltransferase